MSTIQIDPHSLSDKETREAELEEQLEGQERLIHRLKPWSDGDEIYGYMFLNETGSSMGKSFMKAGEARSAFRDLADGDGYFSDGLVFWYLATVEKPRTEAADSHDPGEPPLKYGTFRDVSVEESALI